MIHFLLADKKEKSIRMPSVKSSGMESVEPPESVDTVPVDQMLKKHRKGKGKKNKELAPLGLPQLDKPDAGEIMKIISFVCSIH